MSTNPNPTNPTRPTPAPRPRPAPAPRPSVNCEHVRNTAQELTARGHPEIAQFILRVTGCA